MDNKVMKQSNPAKAVEEHIYSISICEEPSCLKKGSREVRIALEKEIEKAGLKNKVTILISGCLGMCEKAPLLIVNPGFTLYGNVAPDDMTELVQSHFVKGQPLARLVVTEDHLFNRFYRIYGDVAFFGKQMRLTLRNCGVIDPESINDYLAVRGYEALVKALASMTPTQVIDQIKKSGLRGRGGAGFPTGTKWELTAREPANEKFVICNADEGDPGAFMDRSAIEGDPHSIIEGMIIGGYAIGAKKGYIYIRAEYPLAVRRLQIAIKQAREHGFLGDRILGTDFSFDIEIRLGAGAFVCGEETALIHSIEGERGMPTIKPPYPSQRGLFGKPTVINNVETWANVPVIIVEGADWFASLGTAGSKGTKVFALAGNVKNTGLVEVPMGTTIRELVYDVGGGIPNNKKFKAAQTGGPSGGCIPAEFLDTPIDYESLAQIGSIMGSGGLIVMDETACMPNMARFFLEFTMDESCGKCTPCREGTRRMHEILSRICSGQGTMEDIAQLERLGNMVKRTSLCGLGQSAPNPILSTLKYFRNEYVAHVTHKTCPMGVCNKAMQVQPVTDVDWSLVAPPSVEAKTQCLHLPTTSSTGITHGKEQPIRPSVLKQRDAEFETVIASAAGGPNPRNQLIEMMHRAQEIYGYLEPNALRLISERIGVSMAKIYGVATFYHFFSLKPKGRFSISVCMGTACYVKGAPKIMETLSNTLGINQGETTEDMLFTLTESRCLGACGLAPTMMINGRIYGELTEAKTIEIIEKHRSAAIGKGS